MHKLVSFTELICLPCVPTPVLNSLEANYTQQREQSLWSMEDKLSFVQHQLCTICLHQSMWNTLGLMVESDLAQTHMNHTLCLKVAQITVRRTGDGCGHF